MEDHKILYDEFVEGKDNFIVKTTHPRVTFDNNSSEFIVNMSHPLDVKITIAKVEGFNRFKRAIELGDHYDTLRGKLDE